MEQKEKDSKRFISPGGAGLAAICFSLPWFRGCGQDISGAQIASNGGHEFWLILIAAVAIVGGFFVFDGQNNLKKLKPFALVGAILALLIMVLKFIQVKQDAGDMIEILPGSVGTILGLLAVSCG